MPVITGVIFDHDGTLVDSLQVVVEASNQVLVAHGYPPERPDVIIASMIHPTAPRMGLHAGVGDAAQQQRLAEGFYRAALAIGSSRARLYDGVAGLVRGLAARGVAQSVVSNNDGAFVRLLMRDFALDGCFAAMYGDSDMPAPKPDPRGIVAAASAMGRRPEQCVYVGDSGSDAVAAHAAGMRAIGVTWGIHTREQMEPMGFDWLIAHPADLPALLDG